MILFESKARKKGLTQFQINEGLAQLLIQEGMMDAGFDLIKRYLASAVLNFLGINETVNQPSIVHPKRPIEGFACTRSEVSGRRLWGWVQDRFKKASAFNKRFFIANYCPLVFMEESGRNHTPDKLPPHEREPLFRACDEALRRLVEWCQPKCIIGVGKFAESRALAALGKTERAVGTILHPSPASPAANRGWQKQVEKQLKLKMLNWLPNHQEKFEVKSLIANIHFFHW